MLLEGSQLRLPLGMLEWLPLDGVTGRISTWDATWVLEGSWLEMPLRMLEGLYLCIGMMFLNDLEILSDFNHVDCRSIRCEWKSKVGIILHSFILPLLLSQILIFCLPVPTLSLLCLPPINKSSVFLVARGQTVLGSLNWEGPRQAFWL